MFRVIQTIITISVIYFTGNRLSDFIESVIVIPGNLIGMGILYILLSLELVKLDHIKQTGDFLLKHMSLFFVPFGVSILKYFDLIKMDILPLVMIVVITTSVSMLLSAKVVDLFAKGESS
ncbi:MAG: CidA/LrgA family protein [Clostridiales bacterium]|nr:CidA/LrgA family protein [Clostridiales bacterium]